MATANQVEPALATEVAQITYTCLASMSSSSSSKHCLLASGCFLFCSLPHGAAAATLCCPKTLLCCVLIAVYPVRMQVWPGSQGEQGLRKHHALSASVTAEPGHCISMHSSTPLLTFPLPTAVVLALTGLALSHQRYAAILR
jgi:hypothetical protein